MGESLKIVELQVENVKRIKAARIKPSPDNNMILISGANSQGKSTIIDSILYALAGGESMKDLHRPIHGDAEEGKIVLDLGDYIVTRRFRRPNKTDLVIESADGSIRAPQTLLDRIYDNQALDPSIFLNASEKEQRNMFAKAVGVDLEAWENKKSIIYNKRTDLNRTLKTTEGHLKSLLKPDKDTPEKELNSDAVLEKMEAAQKSNAKRNTDLIEINRLESTVKQMENELLRIEAQIAELKKLKIDTEKKKTTTASALNRLSSTITEEVDLTQFKEKLAEIEKTNKAVRHAQAYRSTVEQVQKLTVESNRYTAQLKKMDVDLKKQIQGAKLPVPGLSFSEDGNLLYDDLPFSQAGDAERLAVAVGIAMAQNPRLRIIRIRDGNGFDEKALDAIEAMCKEDNYQVWMEKIVKGARAGILIEDGEIKDDDTNV